MDTIDFFNLVLPTHDSTVRMLYFGTRSPDKSIRTQRNDVLASSAARLSGQSKDVWFATAAFNPHGELNKYDNLSRSAENALYARSAWMDWDVDPEKGKCATVNDAANQVLNFYRKILPPGGAPLILRSGGGLHTYIVFDRDVPAAEWITVADQVKALGKFWKFKFDPTRAADIASLMRPPGTNNYKLDHPRAVSVVNPKHFAIVSWSDYRAHVEHLIATTPIDYTASAESMSASLGTIPAAVYGHQGFTIVEEKAHRPSQYARVLERCQQMRWVVENQDEVAEPLWRAALSVAGRTVQGEQAIHLISRNYRGYSEGETEAKFAGTPAPFLCTEFDNHRPGGCDNCPYKGQIRSPITLGEVVEAAGPIKRDIQQARRTDEPTEQQAPEPVPSYALPVVDIPTLDKKGYKYTGNKLIKTVRSEIVGDDGVKRTKEIDVLLVDHPFYPVNCYVDTRDSTAPVHSSEWYAKPKGAPGKYMQLSSQDLGSKDSVQRWLARTIGYTPTNETHVAMVASGMKLWLEQIKETATMEIPATLGWHRMGPDEDNKEMVFVIGNRMLTAGGIRVINTATHLGNVEEFKPKGTLEGWLQAYAMYQRPGAEKHALATLVGFAAPLIEMSPLASLCVNLTGRTGGGKTTLQHFISSIYGTTQALVKGPEGTQMSQTKFIRDMQNLPVMFDDWHKVAPAELAQRFFNWANGWNSEGLNRSGGVNKERGGRWRTAIVMSTNTDIHEAIKNYFTGDKRAARMRVMQISIPEVAWGQEASTSTQHILMENYGVAGEIWLDYLRRNRTLVAQHLARMQILIEKEWGGTSAERYFVQGCAALMVALYHSIKLRLCPLDMAAMIGQIRQLFNESKAGAADVTMNPATTIANYINANQPFMITTINNKADSATDKLLNSDSRQLVMGRFLKDHYEDPGVLWLLLDPFRDWCKHRNISCAQVQQDLFEAGITEKLESSINVGHKLPSLNTARAKGLIIDMKKLL